MNLSVLEAEILMPAFIAGLLVIASHVPLGREVLRRGIIFVDLAIAQIAAIGVIVAISLGADSHGWIVQLAALASALLGSLMLSWLARFSGQLQEAVIGVSFVLAATASILLLAGNAHGGEQLRELLVGQILWVTWPQLWPTAILTAFILAVWFGYRNRLVNHGFYLMFALAVTASVQLVGIYLVFASLIIPALAGALAGREQLLPAYIIGALGYLCGLVLSAMLDLPSGAVVVWCIATIGLVFVLLGRRVPDETSPD